MIDLQPTLKTWGAFVSILDALRESLPLKFTVHLYEFTSTQNIKFCLAVSSHDTLMKTRRHTAKKVSWKNSHQN